MEQQLAQRPKIAAPSILLYGATDPLARPSSETTPAERAVFPALVARRVIPGAGHFLPREKPEAVSTALVVRVAERVLNALEHVERLKLAVQKWARVLQPQPSRNHGRVNSPEIGCVNQIVAWVQFA